MVIRMGSAKFGPPDEQTRAVIAAVSTVERLEALGERVWEASSWRELLDGVA